MNIFPGMSVDSLETQDKGKLIRALLLLISKDKNIWDHEVRIFIWEAMLLGYEKEFCEDAVKQILRNSHIEQAPPVFFNKKNALKTLNIGIRIIKGDLKPHPEKIEFLEKIALVNGSSGYWKTLGYK